MYNAVALNTFGHAGQTQRIHAGQLIRVFRVGHSRFAQNDSGLEILIRAEDVLPVESFSLSGTDVLLWNTLMFIFSLHIRPAALYAEET